MKDKQTAVEWAEDELSKLFIVVSNLEITIPEYRKKRVWIWEQAKAMEKDQHDLTFARGSMTGYANANGHESKDFEQYYNETYGK